MSSSIKYVHSPRLLRFYIFRCIQTICLDLATMAAPDHTMPRLPIEELCQLVTMMPGDRLYREILLFKPETFRDNITISDTYFADICTHAMREVLPHLLLQSMATCMAYGSFIRRLRQKRESFTKWLAIMARHRDSEAKNVTGTRWRWLQSIQIMPRTISTQLYSTIHTTMPTYEGGIDYRARAEEFIHDRTGGQVHSRNPGGHR